MASFNLTRVDTYPEGTSVGAYKASDWHPTVPPSGAPPGSSIATATMTSGIAAFSGLADDTAYVFGASVSGTWRYVTGRTSALNPALASPTFTGTPAAPTAAADTNTTQLATTAFVLGQAYASNPAINGTAAAGSSPKFARGDHVHPTDTTRAALASPTFTGTPAAPTAANGTNTTQVATTAFVAAQRLDQHAVPTTAVDFNGQAPIKLGTVTFGTLQDTNLYRPLADTLATDDAFNVGYNGAYRTYFGSMQGLNGVNQPGIVFGSGLATNLYMNAVGALKTDGTFATGGNVGFNGTAPLAKPTLTGSRGGNAAVASIAAAMASYGLAVDSTTA